MGLNDQGVPVKLLYRDHDAKFTRFFDDVFGNKGGQVLRTPIRQRRRTPTPSAGSRPAELPPAIASSSSKVTRSLSLGASSMARKSGRATPACLKREKTRRIICDARCWRGSPEAPVGQRRDRDRQRRKMLAALVTPASARE